MNLIEFYPKILNGLKDLNFKASRNEGSSDTPYYITQLKSFRATIRDISDIPYIEDEIEKLVTSWIFNTDADTKLISYTDFSITSTIIQNTRMKLGILQKIVEQSGLFGHDDVLYIKLPELKSFDDLEKTSNELKKAIEIPIIDDSIQGSVSILAGDQGSVILFVAVGTILAVKLVAGICWAAAVIKRKKAEAKIFEAHAKTLELKNDALETLVEAQKQQLKNILTAEAEAIASKHYSHEDPETIERLKLSITSVADLVERGAKILPMNNDEDIQKAFPDHNPSSLIESAIKRLNN